MAIFEFETPCIPTYLESVEINSCRPVIRYRARSRGGCSAARKGPGTIRRDAVCVRVVVPCDRVLDWIAANGRDEYVSVSSRNWTTASAALSRFPRLN